MLFATDLDGTLVPAGTTEIGEYTAQVLGEAEDAGHHVVFVTARPLRWMDELWKHVGGHGMAIVSNGAIIYDAHRFAVRTINGIEPSVGLDLVATIEDAAPGSMFAIECLDGIRLDPHFVDDNEIPPGSPRGSLTELWDTPAAKLLAKNQTMSDDAFRHLVRGTVGRSAVATWSGPELVEISAGGITKASALAGLCEDLGIAQEEVIAFGDMPNDLPLLKWAGTSYAVANADETVLAAADQRAPACSEEGVAQVIASLLR
ncbi:HAD-IIB family hydrolase [Nesterenkonia populi]